MHIICLRACFLVCLCVHQAFRKLDDLATSHTEKLRKLTKQVQEHRQSHDDDAVKKVVEEYDDTLECYIPVLMAQAKIYWDMEDYYQVRVQSSIIIL